MNKVKVIVCVIALFVFIGAHSAFAKNLKAEEMPKLKKAKVSRVIKAHLVLVNSLKNMNMEPLMVRARVFKIKGDRVFAKIISESLRGYVLVIGGFSKAKKGEYIVGYLSNGKIYMIKNPNFSKMYFKIEKGKNKGENGVIR